MEALQTLDLTKHYRSGAFKRKNIPALEKVSLSVEQGEIFGLLGPNGAGKTTFVKLILSIVHPTSGTATVLGYPLGQRALKEYCGYLPENHRYPGFLTAENTLIFFGRLNGLPESTLKEKARSLLETVGLKDWTKVKTKKFSKGMLQRLGLAQALINDPKILFLDEPTDGVDPLGRKEIRDLLLSLKAQGTTIFLNSHLLSEVEMICDRVAILNKGKVVRTGTIAELTTQKLAYVIQLSSPITKEIHERLQQTILPIEYNDTNLIVSLHDKSELNTIIDILREGSVGIEGMAQQKTSLEDYFIQIMKGENEQ
ncbi:MAG: ABC transporter ATP-binding protein [Ignavibacteriales bacterium]|nr:ABC transporter ATP-binding protein [Ignavibacteriales bacterium]